MESHTFFGYPNIKKDFAIDVGSNIFKGLNSFHKVVKMVGFFIAVKTKVRVRSYDRDVQSDV